MAEIQPSSLRNGTYSPNGTSFTFTYRSTILPVASNASVTVRWVPSGSSVTAPAIVGAPTVAIAWLTAVIIRGPT